MKVPHPRGLQTQVDAQERGVVVILQTFNIDGEKRKVEIRTFCILLKLI